MPWRVGVDEAGYGPNLGPLVVASTACHVPAPAPACLWKHLSSAVRRKKDADDGRILIDDSKKVNDGPSGLTLLEAGVLATLGVRRERYETFRDCLSVVAIGDSLGDLGGEPWFAPEDLLPVANDLQAIHNSRSALANACERTRLLWGPIRSMVVPAPKFNHLLDEWKVKSGVIASAVIALLHATLELPGEEPIQITVDKLGGRHYYAPLLNEGFPGGWARVLREGPELCEYQIDGLGREISIRFAPRADGADLNVALASMTAKYLREVCMLQFNKYWLGRVPGIKPTAGYPGDAARFFDEIRGALAKDGVDKRTVWRER
jgi:ribonuclease HII